MGEGKSAIQLTSKDVARLLAVSEKTVHRWIGERKLPCHRFGGRHLFNRAEILEWATGQEMSLSPAVFAEDDALDQPLPGLPEILESSGIHYGIKGDDKESAIRGMVEVLRLPEETDREFLFQMLLAREQLGSTGMGDGIAIPHTRSPIVLHVDNPVMTLSFLEKPVDFGAVDGQPVHAMFTLISPTVRAHLHFLSRLAYALRDEGFKALVRAQAGRDEILGRLRLLSGEMNATKPAKPLGGMGNSQ